MGPFGPPSHKCPEWTGWGHQDLAQTREGRNGGILGGRSEIRAGSLGEEWGGDSSREPEENWVSREGQHMKAGARALEQKRGSRQESSMLEADLGDIQCPGKG